jgi:Replication-relaxation
MESYKRPRFIRSSPGAPLRLTERDRQIIRCVHRHRFLRSPQIIALVQGSAQQILRRLRLLYHHGYLERPRAQIDYYHQGGPRSLVYGLGNKGGTLMRQELGSTSASLSCGENNRAVGRIFLEHALLVSDVMVSLELACRNSGAVRLLTEEELLPPGKNMPFRWRVTIPGGQNLGVVPDRVFGMEFFDGAGVKKRIHFFLEADRGTMPVKRRTLSQTSFYRKLLAYEATWHQSIHKKRFDFARFRVLTVTTSAVRVKSLIEACSKLKRGHGLFLFADRAILDQPSNILSSVWNSGRRGETTTLLS